MTFNLHIAVCRLYDQEAARGAVANDLEFWVERAIQLYKRSVKYRLSHEPEAVLAKLVLDQGALARCRHQVSCACPWL